MKLHRVIGLLLVSLGISFFLPAFGEKAPKNPTVVDDGAGGRLLVLPEDLQNFLIQEFPGYRLPKESDFNPQMLRYYFSQLIGVHPAVAWGDFNNDKRRDYALLVITGDTPWGPLVELVVLNGMKKGSAFQINRLGEIYNIKDDYISYADSKLYKGKFRKGGWYIHWDPKSETYIKHKS